MKDDQRAGGGASFRRRLGRTVCHGFSRLAGFLAYAATAMLLTDMMAWDSDGRIVRRYLQQSETPTAGE
ncbi:hypothetical protein BJN34_08500 [Cupriavidus necator]|uniref:Uncharacterized protein n=1 Tax=Cupriavidus necator TaxID=106590 RepID=A0A1U9UMV9_CUPNE|nr:hypothetical protein [Cupriavidus necator]AQV93930.1 hypothetical protein BJN34_08500 [Cupriavidus necator]